MVWVTHTILRVCALPGSLGAWGWEPQLRVWMQLLPSLVDVVVVVVMGKAMQCKAGQGNARQGKAMQCKAT